jgi:penicillin-binding protein 2B
MINSVQIQSSLPSLTVPDLVTMDPLRAGEVLAARGLDYVILGNGNKVLEQFPEAGTRIGSKQRIILLTKDKSHTLLPDLSGWSLRDAMELCTYLGIEVQVSGEGYVVSQFWKSDGDGQVLDLELQPPGQSLDPPSGPETDGEPSDDTNASG